jgi:hypothetical protein
MYVTKNICRLATLVTSQYRNIRVVAVKWTDASLLDIGLGSYAAMHTTLVPRICTFSVVFGYSRQDRCLLGGLCVAGSH